MHKTCQQKTKKPYMHFNNAYKAFNYFLTELLLFYQI